MPLELWVEILGGAYAVSSLGRVERRLANGRNAKCGRILRQTKTPYGYLVVNLSVEGKARTVHIHKLVADAFLGKRPVGFHINHKDGNKCNNDAHNLEYVTPKANVRHAIGLGLHPRGERHGMAKLDKEQVKEIRALRRRGLGYSELADIYSVCPHHIGKIVRGELWR